MIRKVVSHGWEGQLMSDTERLRGYDAKLVTRTTSRRPVRHLAGHETFYYHPLNKIMHVY